MSDKEDLVAVMLPRDTVDVWAKNGEYPGNDHAYRTVAAACKKALRPKFPTEPHYALCIGRDLNSEEMEEVRSFLEEIREHGWEPGQ